MLKTIKVTDPKKEEKIADQNFSKKISYVFLFLAVILSFSTNYLTSYFYDLQETMLEKNINAISALALLLIFFYLGYREIKKLNK